MKLMNLLSGLRYMFSRLGACAVAGVVAIVMPVVVKAQDVSTDTLMKHIIELSSERYEGRQAGTWGYNAAVKYCVDVLRSYGVEPAGENGGWLQEFDVECNEIDNCTFNTYLPGTKGHVTYSLGRDFSCAAMTGRGYADANVVFCGYGIDASAYDDYADVDARGKVVVVASGVPNFLPSEITDRYATLRDKARVAKKHGAVALVSVNMSKTCADFEVQCRGYNGELPHLATFPIIQPTKYCAEALFRGEEMPIDEALAKIQDDHKPHSFAFNKKFEIETNAKYRAAAKTCNIVGIMHGTSKKVKREYIVVGAHLDHVGRQGETCFYPGADDDASSVAALLETARLISDLPADKKPARSVVFVIFSGSEQLDKGTYEFIDHFRYQGRIEAFLSIDCIGSGDSIDVRGNARYPNLWGIACHNDSLYTHAVGRSKKTIKVYATEEELAERARLKKLEEKEAAKDPKKAKALKKQKPTGNERFSEQVVEGFQTMPTGDALAFQPLEIPSLVFTTFNGKQHEHTPYDIAENINRETLTKATSLVYHTLCDLLRGYYQGRSFESKLQVYGPIIDN